jgi:MFS family permease
MASYLHAISLFSRNVKLYLVTSALLGFSLFGGIYTVLLNLYLLRLNYGPEIIGLVNAGGLLGLALFCIPAGILGGRWGSQRAMVVGLVASVTGWGLLPLAEFVAVTARPGWLLGMNLLANCGLALYLVNANPFLMAATTEIERNHVYSAQAAVWPLAGFMGSLVGGLLPGLFAARLALSLDHPAPYRYSLLTAAVLLIPGIIALRATQQTVTPALAETGGEKQAVPLGIIGTLAVIVFFQVAGEGIGRTFFNVYLDSSLGIATSQIGMLLAAGQLLAVPAALATPLLAARWGLRRIYLLASLGMALSLIPLALIPHWGAAGLAFMCLIALASVTRPAISVYQMEIVAPTQRSAMSAATTMAVGISWSSVASGGGYLITLFGYPVLFLMGTVLTMIAVLFFWLHMRMPAGRHSSADESPIRI